MKLGATVCRAGRLCLRRLCPGVVIPWKVVLCCHRLVRGLTGESSPLLATSEDLTLAQQRIEDPLIRDELHGLKLTGWGIDVDTLNWLVRFMRGSGIARVLEFGSGLSSLVFAHCCRVNTLASGCSERTGDDPMVISIEQDGAFAARTREMLETTGLSQVTRVIHAPLVKRNCGKEMTQGYGVDLAKLPDVLADWTADLVFVDGPATDDGLGRMVAVEDSISRASRECRLLLDDAFRGEEMDMFPCLQRRGEWLLQGIAVVGKGLAVGLRSHSDRATR